jgi:mannose-6-phosphate isomerase-like protein (cupin superfamily)
MGVKQGLVIVKPGDGALAEIGGMGVHFKVWGDTTAGELSIVEHPMEPRRLVPPHVHHDEDELSYVLEGTFGVRVGDDVATAGPGTYIYKPKGVPHTFWNVGPEPAKLLEIIWPAGFERFFESLGDAARSAGSPERFFAQRAELAGQYHVDFIEGWAEELKDRYQLKLLGEP